MILATCAGWVSTPFFRTERGEQLLSFGLVSTTIVKSERVEQQVRVLAFAGLARSFGGLKDGDRVVVMGSLSVRQHPRGPGLAMRASSIEFIDDRDYFDDREE